MGGRGVKWGAEAEGRRSESEGDHELARWERGAMVSDAGVGAMEGRSEPEGGHEIAQGAGALGASFEIGEGRSELERAMGSHERAGALGAGIRTGEGRSDLGKQDRSQGRPHRRQRCRVQALTEEGRSKQAEGQCRVARAMGSWKRERKKTKRETKP